MRSIPLLTFFTILIKSLLLFGNSRLSSFICISLLVILISSFLSLIFTFSTDFSFLFQIFYLTCTSSLLSGTMQIQLIDFLRPSHPIIMIWQQSSLKSFQLLRSIIFKILLSRLTVDLYLIKLLKIRPLPPSQFLRTFPLKKLCRIFLSLILTLYSLLIPLLSLLAITILFLRLWVGIITILLLLQLVAFLISRDQPNQPSKSKEGCILQL